jgi:hypothetical protein
MHVICVLLAFLAAPFWETTAPKDWTDEQVQLLLNDSPWAQAAGPKPEVQIYLATAGPTQQAEAELARRRKKPLGDDYLDYMKEEGSQKVVLAIAYANWTALEEAEESRRMQDESVMKVGRKKYQMMGHFPPTPSDKFLRLVYPRAATAEDKTVIFELYLPGNGPYHDAEFRVRDMLYKGKLEM